MKKTLALVLALVLVACSASFVSLADVDTSAPYTFTMYSNISTELTDAERTVIDQVAASQNLTVDVQMAAASNYTESLQLMMASGEYPELVLFPDTTSNMYVDGARDGAFLPLNSYLESGDFTNLTDYTYDISWDVLDVLGTGEIFSLPRTSIARQDCLEIRADWLEAMGYEYDDTKPVTLEWLTKVMYDFTFNDPDGNGINDTYGLAMNSGDGNLFIPGPIALAFGISGWREYDGEYMNLQYSKTNDSYKRALAWTAEQYALGTIDPDWATLNVDAQRERFYQGVTGICGEFVGWMSNDELKCQMVNEDAKLSYLVFVVENEGQEPIGGSYSTGYWGAWSIMYTAEQPERIMGFMNALLSDEHWTSVKYGPEGQRWETDENGNVVATADFANLTYLAPRQILRRNNDPGFFISLDLPVEQRTHVEEILGVCIEQAIFPLDNNYRPAVADDPTFIDYTANMNVQISKIVVGDLEVDAWDGILEGWYAAGGDSYVADMQAYIASTQGK